MITFPGGINKIHTYQLYEKFSDLKLVRRELPIAQTQPPLPYSPVGRKHTLPRRDVKLSEWPAAGLKSSKGGREGLSGCGPQLYNPCGGRKWDPRSLKISF